MEATLSSKNQTTIPKPVREHLKLKPGDKFKFFILPDGDVVILPLKPITALKGILPKRAKPLTQEEIDAGIEEGALARYRRFQRQ
jgi:antitoxin PrlF